MKIVDLFYGLSRQHIKIKGFYYSKSYEKGAGNHSYPLLWLDDPIRGRSINNRSVIQYTVNFDVLGIPETPVDVLNVQREAETVGLEIIEKINEVFLGYTVSEFDFLTLSDYYDDKAAGIRFTVTLTCANPVDICVDVFDPNKELTQPGGLPDFNIEHPDGCAVFKDKKGLSNFKI